MAILESKIETTVLACYFSAENSYICTYFFTQIYYKWNVFLHHVEKDTFFIYSVEVQMGEKNFCQ